ncbi:Phage protein [plant metagenome]|uniref:Phage protein n=1 Tax=plant metagenome TaxID=1297885 RepID=A0A484U2T5_9ZZZZ
MNVATYDPKRVILTFGANQIKGFTEGTFINVEEITDGTTRQAGADGEVARVMSTDTGIRITVTLQQTSLSNAILSAYLKADRLGGGGALPVTLTDLRGATVAAAGSAWIVKMANAEFGQELGSREWVIETGPAEYFVGGNT